ncbi:MAG: DUF72 domain-containing protein [Syntrophaceae bacterium]|nr:DUF72 domain-containing protein [Syntrophaceae bacterium]
MPAREYLAYYSARFRCLEVNSTFYRLPLESTLARWRDLVPAGFVFAVKASRYITHIKRLGEPSATVGPFLERIRTLGVKLGPILFQLPARFPFNGELLESFCHTLDKGFRYAFEFRDPGWFRDETYDILKKRGAAFCIYDFAGLRSPDTVTADFVYIRLHGPLKEPYRGKYPDSFLQERADAIRGWLGEGRAVYVFFDNTMEGDAVRDALKLADLLEEKANPEKLL